MKKIVVLILLLIQGSQASAECEVHSSKGVGSLSLNDAFYKNLKLLNNCPENIFELKLALKKDGLEFSPSMVANRGIHNPNFGSFSFFETVRGESKQLGRILENNEIYIGHFTQARGGVVDLDQTPAPGKLMIELIAWDPSKQVYNFYELIGKASGANWLYRGDSMDVYRDNRFLHQQVVSGSPQFGSSMRCSGCHTSGGPIMKELQFPQNDWWSQVRPLPLGNNLPSEDLNNLLLQLMDASGFSLAVESGIKKLEESNRFQKFKNQLSLPEQLRPLFCTNEINLISDQYPLESPVTFLQIPTEYWVNPMLAESEAVKVSKSDYLSILVKEGFKFPEINRRDADHGWLAPVKGYSDLSAIKKMVKLGLIDLEFVADVLAVDFKAPLFSEKRCSLLKFLPELAVTNWKNQFVAALQTSNFEAAQELWLNLTDSQKDQQFHHSQAIVYLAEVNNQIKNIGILNGEVIKLHHLRESVFENEISKNPLGQILEPGFRVIFPEKQ